MLLGVGISPSLTDYYGMNALHMAVLGNSVHTINAIMTHSVWYGMVWYSL